MITELTPEQEAQCPIYAQKWIDIGINTDRVKYDRALDIVNDVQEHLLQKPRTPVILVDDPIEAWIACHFANTGVPVNQILAKVDEFYATPKKDRMKLESFSTPYLVGSFDASIWSFYDYCQQVLGVDYKDKTENFNIWKATSELGMIFPFDHVCIVSQKPMTIKLNENRVAHCDGGPAIEYAGRGNGISNIKIFMLNGVRVPEWLATTPSGKLTMEDYTRLTNADEKMEFIRKFGVERMLDMGKKLDSYENYNKEWWTRSQYELWDMNCLFDGVDYAPHLKMLNQTTGVWHVEAVSPECKTLEDAIKERFNGMDLDIQAIA